MTEPIVKIEEGQLKGKISNDYLGESFYSFQGIPYGKPPVGELRFKAPEPVDPWTGVKDATKPGVECPSHHLFFRYYVGNENNCLNLNVFTKELPTTAKSSNKTKPVMVWIHGGGFTSGSNKMELFGPDYLITEDIVLVSINYRLGVLGFLSLEDPSLGVPGNNAFKDMVLALKWVKRNIHHFMGDPNNVTIFGESAGSASVHYLVLSPLTKGLFHKAITQSGSVLNPWAQGRSNGVIIAKYLGIDETNEKKILDYLRSLPAKAIVNASSKSPDLFLGDIVRPFGPVVEKPSDNAFLSEEPLKILQNGTFNTVPIIMGYNSNEGIFFEVVRKLIPQANLINNDFEREIDHNLHLKKKSPESIDVAKQIKSFYYGKEDPSEENLEKTFLMKSDVQFVSGIQRAIQHQKVHSSSIYMYRMSLEGPLNNFKKICLSKYLQTLFFFYYLTYRCGFMKNICLKLANSLPVCYYPGACHADDVGYLFNSFMHPIITPGSDTDIYIKRFVKLWTNFAKFGNPTPNQSELNITWKPVTLEENHYLDIGKELKVGINPDKDRMEFWFKIYQKFQL